MPAGWNRYSDADEGWSLAHPPGWTVSSRNGLRQFRDPSTGRTLRVDHGEQSKGDPVKDWRNQSRAFAKRFPSYDEIRIDGLTYRSWPAADWEFTFTDGGTDLHVLNRNIVVGDEAYALYWQTPERTWPGSLEVYEQVASTFTPGPQGPQ